MATGEFCTNCGAQLDRDAQFCVSCGQSRQGDEGQWAAVANATVVQEPVHASVDPTASTDPSVSCGAVDHAFPTQAASPVSVRTGAERAEPDRTGRGGRGPVIAATVAIVFSALSISLSLLYLFIWPAATNRIASVGWQQEQSSGADLTSSSPPGNAGSQDSRSTHTSNPGRPSQEQSSDADLTSSSPSENAGSKSSGSASDQGAAASGAPKNSPTEGERDPGYRTGYHEPFWGVWTFASKSASEAMECATSMTAKGFDSTIELTTDWSNLNDEEWYVVTTGMWRDREEAESMASSLWLAGYSDAYAKYSGEYVGDKR